MGEQKGQEKPVVLDSAELEGVTGGASWNDDPEAIENVRREQDIPVGGIVTEPDGKTSPVAGAGVLDKMALGLDRVKEGLTSIAVRK